MHEIKFTDRADEFRVAITGKFSIDCVHEVERRWRSVLLEFHSRRFTVDISSMSGFDLAGRKLLRDMYNHGAVFAASTPLSLVFLNEISTRRRGPTLMPETEQEWPADRKSDSKPFLAARAAGSGK